MTLVAADEYGLVDTKMHFKGTGNLKTSESQKFTVVSLGSWVLYKYKL